MDKENLIKVYLATENKPGHYDLTMPDCEIEDLVNKIFAVRFDKIVNPTYPSFLCLNKKEEYPLYNSDGTTFLSLDDLYEATIFITLINYKWQLVKTIFRSNENVGHILTDTKGQLLPNRQVLKLNKFIIQDKPSEGALELINPIWGLRNIEGIRGAINSTTWTPIYNDILIAPNDGTYKITVNLCLNNIDEPMREVGVRVKDREDWTIQIKRLRHSFVIVGEFNKGDSLVPEVFVDKMSTSNTINIEECSFYVECANTQEL